MYGLDHIREDVIYLMFYAGVTVFCLMACCYLQFRRANAVNPDITPPLRLRRLTAALLGALTLSYLLYTPVTCLSSPQDIKTVVFVGALFDFAVVLPLTMAVLITMLQDRQRPLWPIAVVTAPLAVGVAVCLACHYDDIPTVLYVYYLLLIIGYIIYMVRATRQYGQWLRDNYADLEHKEVWRSLVVLAIILTVYSLYMFEEYNIVYKYAARVNTVILACFLVWRTETLSDLNVKDSTPPLSEEWPGMSTSAEEDADVADEEAAMEGELLRVTEDKISVLLQRHCVDEKLYLQHDLTVHQLARAIGTNRFYLSQYFSRQETTYNTYINGLRIDHFVNLYHKAVAAKQPFTVRQLAQDSGYRNYTTFSNAFKQRMGKNVTTWISLL